MKCLYITYDGLTDNLGASQILPYIYGLAAAGHRITVLSCEKRENFSKRGAAVNAELASKGIAWQRLWYHKRPPVLSTVWDIWRMAFCAWRAGSFEAVHVRSYVPAVVGLALKRISRTKLIFDMRGFWADERVDGGLWNMRKPAYRFIFRLFKRLERNLLLRADAVVCLTEAAREEMLSWRGIRESRLEERLWVIPCCVEIGLFAKTENSSGAPQVKVALKDSGLVCGYLGSVGTWYCIEEMMSLFQKIQARTPTAKFLLITPDAPKLILAAAAKCEVAASAIVVVAADRREVPGLLSMVDVGIFFIRPCYSKISSSATKLGEFMAAGVPVIANHGIGDQSRIFADHDLGHLVKDFSASELQRAAERIPDLLAIDGAAIRAVAEKEFSLGRALAGYAEIYDFLSPGKGQKGESRWPR
ncbi:MAG: glycosyltransferase [Bacteriovoracia bacterium]